MEITSKRRMRRGQLERALLGSVAIAGIGLMAIAAPNTVQLLKKIDPDWIFKRDPKQRLQETASRLKKKGLILFVLENGRMRMRITSKGKRILQHSIAYHSAFTPPRKWDGKWRLVIFDIPEKKRGLRIQIRNAISSFGFHRLQDSVWAYPYDCEELIALLKAELRIGTQLLYIIADAIEFDRPLKEVFNLA